MDLAQANAFFSTGHRGPENLLAYGRSQAFPANPADGEAKAY